MHDIGVIGLGAMGLASAWAGVRAGASVIAFDAFGPGHSHGSSHGETRMIRRIYSEGRVYMPLLEQSYALWTRLEAEAGERLFHQTGGLDIAPDGHALLNESRSCANAHSRPYIFLDSRTANDCWPALHLPENCGVIQSPESGVLMSDAANAALARLARASGARLNWNTPVSSVQPDGDGFMIITPQGKFPVRRVINAAGPWADEFSPALGEVIRAERQVIGYFDGPPGDVPPFQRVLDDGRRLYLLPAGTPGRWKFGLYHHRQQAGPEFRGASEVDAEDRRLLTACLKTVLPGCPPPDRFEVCRFTNTADTRFIIDRDPEQAGMVILAACSGHGYKFAPATGEAAVTLALDAPLPVDLTAFTLARQLPH